jgi:hypothetical protein
MKILQAKNNASSIEYSPWFTEYICVNVHHQIATLSIFHHEAQMLLQQIIPETENVQEAIYYFTSVYSLQAK